LDTLLIDPIDVNDPNAAGLSVPPNNIDTLSVTVTANYNNNNIHVFFVVVWL
jgi:hypothetical protein